MDDQNQALLKELFEALPQPIQKAITSADVQKKLRTLADKHKLHLDQWESLENEFLDSLLGLKQIEDLQGNIERSVGVSSDVAAELVGDISAEILAPIRKELERGLEHPEAEAKEMSGVEAAREQMLTGAPAVAPSIPPIPTTTPSIVQPATPPPPPPSEKAIRMPSSGAYKPGEASIARKDIHDDPYREPPA